MPATTQDQQQFKGTRHVPVASPAFSSCVLKSQLCDPNLTIGVGAGALYMLVTCNEEMKRLNKTLEETENLVEELKEQLQRYHEERSHCHRSAEDRTSPSRGLSMDMDYTSQPNFPLRISNLDEFSEEHVPATRGMARDQMAVLAAELEAELELMELNMKAEETLPFETLIHDAGEVSSKGISSSYYSDTSSHGLVEASDIGRPSAHSETYQMDHGVPAIELDHRLREVLEAQQQERILELEQLLKETKAKLLAKEHEIFCWKSHVTSLRNLLQHPSACGAHKVRLKKPSGVESVNLPEVTKSTIDICHSFQDPPISTQVNFVGATSTSDSKADVYKQDMGPHRFLSQSLSDEKDLLNKANIPVSHCLIRSTGLLHNAGESNCCLDYEGAAIDTPEYVIMKEHDTQTAAAKSEILRNSSVSKASERGNSMIPDGWGNEIWSSYSSNDHPGPLVVHTDTGCPHSTATGPVISRLHHMKYMNVGYEDEDGAPLSRTQSEISHLHHMKSKLDVDETSVSLGLGSKEEIEESDIKHVVGFFMPKQTLLDQDCESCGQDAIQAAERNMKSKNKSLEPVSRGSRINKSDRLVEVTSPVLDKIRHFEALGGRILGRQI